jgi:hypothetical protein
MKPNPDPEPTDSPPEAAGSTGPIVRPNDAAEVRALLLELNQLAASLPDEAPTAPSTGGFDPRWLW